MKLIGLQRTQGQRLGGGEGKEGEEGREMRWGNGSVVSLWVGEDGEFRGCLSLR